MAAVFPLRAPWQPPAPRSPLSRPLPRRREFRSRLRNPAENLPRARAAAFLRCAYTRSGPAFPESRRRAPRRPRPARTLRARAPPTRPSSGRGRPQTDARRRRRCEPVGGGRVRRDGGAETPGWRRRAAQQGSCPSLVVYAIGAGRPGAKTSQRLLAHKGDEQDFAISQGDAELLADERVVESRFGCIAGRAPEKHAMRPGPVNRAKAHRTVFAGSVNVAAVELEGAQGRACRANRNDFRMRRRIVG